MRSTTLLVLGILAGCEAGGSVAYQPGSPWPKFRGDATHTGASTIRPTSTRGAFWSYQTGKGIFSSPVVGVDGTIYVGSADRSFYALKPDGTLAWKIDTGEIIDSAALLDDRGRVYFGSGDGNLRAADARTGALVWMQPADAPSVNSAFINWFEGNVALSPSGELFAGNDNFFVYGFDRATGAIKDRIKMPDQTWSLPAFDASGRFFVGNNNVVQFLGSNLFAFDAKGAGAWDIFSGAGSVAASPMIAPSGVVVVGGFDGFVRAYDPSSGAVKWELGARDHIYASPALGKDGSVLQPAADGTVYAIDPATGALKWQFDGRDPIRSSPAVDGDGNIYFGSGDGRLYVLGPDGTLRWSIALITADRNDVNASPALGQDAIYIAGESGEVFSVPYEYCLRAGTGDARCAPPPAPALPDDGAALLYTTPFGSQSNPPTSLAPNQPIVLSLVARKSGHTTLALLDQVTATFTPPATTTVEVSGDGKFVTVTPTAPLTAAADGTVGLDVEATYLVNPDRVGLKLSNGTPGGSASAKWRAPLLPAQGTPYAPTIPGATWQVSRLALPLPTLLPSYNQIGFDSLQYLVALVEGSNGHAVAWMAGAKLDASNHAVIDPATRALFPLDVDYAGGFVTFQNQDGVSVEVMNAVIPFRSFRMAAALDTAGDAVGPLHVTGSTICMGIPTYGLFLQKLGLCNPTSDVLAVSGAANFTRYADAAAPAGVGTVAFSATTDAVTATLTGTTLPLAEHVAAVLLVDAATGKAVTLDYGLQTTRKADAGGVLQSVSVAITGKTVPPQARVYLMIDMWPAATATIAVP
jgi:outer membrane protein assembly factor BamB